MTNRIRDLRLEVSVTVRRSSAVKTLVPPAEVLIYTVDQMFFSSPSGDLNVVSRILERKNLNRYILLRVCGLRVRSHDTSWAKKRYRSLS